MILFQIFCRDKTGYPNKALPRTNLLLAKTFAPSGATAYPVGFEVEIMPKQPASNPVTTLTVTMVGNPQNAPKSCVRLSRFVERATRVPCSPLPIDSEAVWKLKHTFH